MRGERRFRFEDIPRDPGDLLRECRVSFYRASGPGGQHRNKTETAVRIVHLPTGVTAVAADARSQWQNRQAAVERLHEKLLRQLRPRKPRHATRVPESQREKRLHEKQRASQRKRLRRAGPEE